MMLSRTGPAALLCEGRMDESIADYRKALLEEVITNGDEPENACMRSFEHVKRALEQYERWVWQHRGRRDLDDAEWCRQMQEAAREFWAFLTACSALARDMVCLSAERFAPVVEEAEGL